MEEFAILCLRYHAILPESCQDGPCTLRMHCSLQGQVDGKPPLHAVGVVRDGKE